MVFLGSDIIVIALIAVITALLAVMIWLNMQFLKEKKMYKMELESLQHIISESTKKHSGQLIKMKLSEELDKKLKSDNATLGKKISGLNYALFELLSTNNLLKK